MHIRCRRPILIRGVLSANEIEGYIESKKDFRLQGWDQRDTLLRLLKNAGFNRLYQSQTLDPRAYGGQFYLRNDKGDHVAIIATNFFGPCIDVNFTRDR